MPASQPMLHDGDDASGHMPRVPTGPEKFYPVIEYKIMEVEDIGDLQEQLNDLGKDGWNLVGTSPALIFSRPKREEKQERPKVGFGR